MQHRSWFVVLVAAALWSSAMAQQPVTSPIYYLSTAPRLSPTQPVTGMLTERSGQNFKDGTYLDVVTLRGEAGQYVEILATSQAFDTYLTLFGPDGLLLDRNDDDPYAVGTDAAIRTVLPETGTYLVVVSGFAPWDLGPYTLTLTTAGADTVGGSVLEVPSLTLARLEAGSPVARFQFGLDEVTVVAIAARSTSFDTTLELLDAHGWQLAFNDDAPVADGYGTDSAVVALLGPGTYRVVVQPYYLESFGDGEFELEISTLTPLP